MHKLPNKFSIIRFRVAALLACVNNLLISATIVVLAYSYVTHVQEFAIIGLKLAASIAILFPIRLAITSTCQCPLCRVPVLAGKACSKSTKAKSFLGSYRLRVALQILLKNRFRCPYCNETTEIKSRR